MLGFIKNKYSFLLVISIALFIAGTITEEHSKNSEKHGKTVAETVRIIISQEEDKVQSFIQLLNSQLSDKGKSVNLPLLLEELTKGAPAYLTYFVNRHDSLIYWSNNQVPYSRSLNDNADKKFIFHKNGWYINYFIRIDEFTINGLYLIKHEYPFENNYLKNEFNKSLKIPENFILVNAEDSLVKSFNINNAEQLTLFSISPNKGQNLKLLNISLTLYFISVLLFFIYLIFIIQFFRNAQWWQVALVMLTITTIRLLSIYFKFLEAVYNTQAFSPSHYATSYLLNSLGDLTINTLIIISYILILYQVWRYTKITIKARGRTDPGHRG